MPEESRSVAASRYDTIIATLVGVCALTVSGYTAYIQRQQVRAAVWPILEYNSSNEPEIRFNLDNKGVGPAIIRHVRVNVDGQPVRNWYEALQKLLGPGHHPFSESNMSGHVLSPGESMNILVPHDRDGSQLPFDKSNPLWQELDKDRARISVEICYCSTLDECWTLLSGPDGNSTIESHGCLAPSATSFTQ